jgi:hypothetical protein
MNSSSNSKRLFACLALLLAHFAAAPGQTPRPQTGGTGVAPAEWREFTSEEGRFKVRLPAEPQYEKMPFKLADAITADQHMYFVQHGDTAVFMVAYMDLPPGGGKNPESSIEGAIIGATRGIVGEGGRVLSTGKVSRGPCEGRMITAATRDSATGQPTFRRGEVFRSGLRAYILLFMAPGSGDEPATREMSRAFMESFVVADGCRGALPPTKPLAPKTTSTVEGTPDAATGWRQMGNTEHGFSVLMPGAATLERAQMRAEPVEMFTHTYMHTAEKALYVAEVRGDYPAGFFSGPDSQETMLDIALNNGRRGLEPYGVTLKHLRDLKLGPHLGREYDLVSERLGGAVGRARVYITPKRIYWFAAVEADAARRGRDLERFFSSIKIEAQ